MYYLLPYRYLDTYNNNAIFCTFTDFEYNSKVVNVSPLIINLYVGLF